MWKAVTVPCTTLAMILALSGCGRSLPPKADPEVAKNALKQALASWKAGESGESLRNNDPPIYFNEFRQRTMKLKDFEIETELTTHGQSLRLVALLTVQQKDGKQKDSKTAYLIDTSPSIVIAPE